MMLDGLVARISGPTDDLRALAASGIPVINATSADEHPTQADRTTSRLSRGAEERCRT